MSTIRLSICLDHSGESRKARQLLADERSPGPSGPPIPPATQNTRARAAHTSTHPPKLTRTPPPPPHCRRRYRSHHRRHSRTHPYARAHACTYRRTHTCAHALTRVHTHTHTNQTPPPPFALHAFSQSHVPAEQLALAVPHSHGCAACAEGVRLSRPVRLPSAHVGTHCTFTGGCACVCGGTTATRCRQTARCIRA